MNEFSNLINKILWNVCVNCVNAEKAQKVTYGMDFNSAMFIIKMLIKNEININ